MSEWIDTLSGWTGISSESLVPLLVFVLVVALIVVGFITVALVFIFRPGPGDRRDRRDPPE